MLAFLSNFVIGLLTDINANKINGIFISATYMELVSLKQLYKYKKCLFEIIMILYLASFIMFLYTYFVTTKDYYKKYWDNGAAKACESLKGIDKQIYGDNIVYTYSLIANPINPREFWNSIVKKDNEIIGYKNYLSVDLVNSEIDDKAIYLTYNENLAKTLFFNNGFSVRKEGYCYILSK